MQGIGRTRIKICGITSEDAARAAVEAGADAIGLVFAPRSPRCVDPETARAVAEVLPPFVSAVAVHQDEPDARVAGYGYWCLQLHGEEDEAYVQRLRRARPDAIIIRGFRFSEAAVTRWNAVAAVSAILVDGSAGGRGAAFDHEALGALIARITKPVILAGGLTAENVGRAIRSVRPFAVDVSSGVESAPGRKDPELVAAFCRAVRRADALP